VVTGQDQGVRGRYDYLPFGEEVYAGRSGYGGEDIRQRFTGKERDEESGLDYFEARYYTNTQGRFTSVDPLMASGSAGSPQSWNRYAYAINNPLRFTDPTGMSPGDFYNQDGKRLGTDGISDGKAYVVTDDAQAKQIQQADKAGGTTQVSTVSSAVELPDLDVRQAIGNAVDRSNSPTADDTKGGFHEEGLMWGTDSNGKERIINSAPGAYANPQVDSKAEIEVNKPANPAEAGVLTSAPNTAHIHPKGEVEVSEGPKSEPGTICLGCATKVTTYNFDQPPSTKDVANALPGTNNVVVGAREKKVYIYDNSGVRATFPLKQFLSIGKK
jgi:RHS repeat-associated protein